MPPPPTPSKPASRSSTRATWEEEDAYAGFVRRAAAAAIDVFVVGMLLTLLAPLLGAGELDAAAMQAATPPVSLQLLALVLVLYDVLMTSHFGWTLGKRAVGIEVRTTEGHLPWAGLAVGRFFCRYASAAPLLLGFLWAVFDRRHQTWHDKLCRTYVLTSAKLRPVEVRTAGDLSPGGHMPQTPSQPPASPVSPVSPVSPGSPGSPVNPGSPASPASPATFTRTTPASDGDTSALGHGEDPNRIAAAAAGLAPADQAWLEEVAAQVDERLDRIASGWRHGPTAPVARATAFGLLLGHLARQHPGHRPQLSRVAEAHPSFNALLVGSRLSTLEQIAGDPERVASWLGPLVEERRVEVVARLFE